MDTDPRVPVEARPAGERLCRCVSTHCPAQLSDEAEGHHVWPLGEGGPDVTANMRWLCPTTHTKVHNLWRAYVKAAPNYPAWEILRRYSPFVRDIVADGWGQRVGTRSIPTNTADPGGPP